LGKKKVTILGGGKPALTSAFEITNASGWQDEFDVTVYQLGWRLGGKGASGRNGDHYERIEEHGLHILLGFYENAFRVLKAAYAELGRPPDAPLATWRDAFKPHDYVVLMEQLDAAGTKWTPWPMDFPPNSDEPGTGGVLPTPWAMIQMMVGWIFRLFESSEHLPDHPDNRDEIEQHAAAGPHRHDSLKDEIRKLRRWLHDTYAEDIHTVEHDLRRVFVTVDLGFAAIIGMIEDGVIWPPHDYFKLDGDDFRAWLSHHGAHRISVDSAYIRGMYDLGFSLPGQVGAGTALNGILRMVWTYKGAVMWKMQAGTGDTIFAPLYLVLKQRGVKFRFFHRVDELKLSADKTAVETIVIGRQVTVTGGDDAYDPLVPVKDLPCWPSEPRYGQLDQGAALKASGEDLEDWWTKWKDPVPPLELKRGEDFDIVVLGCSVGIFPYIAEELIDASPRLATMVKAVGTTQTQALQLWLATDLAGLGWTLPSPVLDAYAEPMDTWADMTHLLPREAWPPDAMPRNLAYLCSPLPDDEPPPPRGTHGYTQRQNARVRENAAWWLNKKVKALWPNATRPDNPNGIDWNLLVAPGSPSVGEARLDTQYWLATMNPSDRYVLALPNSVQHRLRADESGFVNVIMAGDYLRTGMNVGCVEAATMGGMHASRAICGRPEEIIGDDTGGGVAPSDELPPFIARGGELVMAPPLELQQATMYSFLVDANMDALTRLVDQQLNAVTTGAGTQTVYRPLLPLAAFVCADIRKSFSTTPPDSKKGWMAERDFGVWLPLVAGIERDGRFHADRLVWYLPYVFVDNVAAMVTGREVFGFFKQTATLGMPEAPTGTGTFTTDALVIQTFSPQSEAKTVRLLNLASTKGVVAEPGAGWTGPKDAIEALVGDLKSMFFDAASMLHVSSWSLIETLLHDAVRGLVPMAFLKQFRDCGVPARACYQAVIEAPAKLQKWHGGGLCHPHDLTILPCDSHPIAKDLGLSGSTVRSSLGFWTQMDFVMEAGKVIAQRP
jgi:uncharacterized protein with NAD-binding domain and iron-sulfur cluster